LKEQENYNFGGTLNSGSCIWAVDSLSYDFVFNGKIDNYNGQNLAGFNQEYQFKGMDTNKLGAISWNHTYNNYNNIWNRALGEAFNNNDNLIRANQSSHSQNATHLNGGSFLLGLQSVNSISNQDININRPQLQTSWRNIGDNFSGIDTDAGFITNTGINSNKSRTGQPSLRSAVPLN
jgi:hypothetical protein